MTMHSILHVNIYNYIKNWQFPYPGGKDIAISTSLGGREARVINDKSIQIKPAKLVRNNVPYIGPLLQ